MLSKQRQSKFKALVQRSPECWLWMSRTDRDGYGRIYFDGQLLAHRVAYSLWIGPIAPGLCVLHTCDNRRCVNPAHLELGSQRANLADMYAKGRDNLSGLQRGQRPEVLRNIGASMKHGANGRFVGKAK